MLRPDLSHAVTKLASGITRWSTNHDKMLYRPVCYLSTATDFGVLASMKGTPIPFLCTCLLTRIWGVMYAQ